VGNVGEMALSVVPIENVSAVVGYVEIGVAIPVVVAGTNALRPAAAGQACLRGHVGEGAVAIVPVKVVGRDRFRREASHSRAIRNEDVGPAIVIVIEDRNASASAFEDKLLHVLLAYDRFCGQTGFRSDIDEIGKCGSGPGGGVDFGLETLEQPAHGNESYAKNRF